MAEKLSAEAQALVAEGMRLAKAYASAEIDCLSDVESDEKMYSQLEAARNAESDLRAHLERMAAEIERGRSLTENPARELIADAVVGAMASGYQGANAPHNDHWLARFWDEGRRQAETDCGVIPRLDRPARVGGSIFGKGIGAHHVIEAAQRAYATAEEEAAKTPEQRREDEIKRRAFWDMIHGPVAQPAREPMSVERINEIGNALEQQGDTMGQFARAIERECAERWGVTLAQGERP